MIYNVFAWDSYENYTQVLYDVDAEGLKMYLQKYSGYIDDLTIIEGRIANNVDVVRELGLNTHRGRIQR